MKSRVRLITMLGSLLGIGLFLITAPNVRAVEYATPELQINGETVYDGDIDRFYPESLPAGVTFDSSSYTVTLTNANIVVPSQEAFIDGLSYGGSQTYDLHVKLVGNNTVTYKSESYDEDEIYDEVFHNNGNMIIEGTGSLTVKNNMSGVFEAHTGDRRDLTIKDCTITCANGYDTADMVDVKNLTLDNCVLNTSYSTEREGQLAYIQGRLVMKNATWNLNTSGSGGEYEKVDVRCVGNAEFHNSRFIVKGDRFWGFSMSSGEVIFDNSTFLGQGDFQGINGGDPSTYTYYNFVTKHQCHDSYENIKICSGKYSAADFHPYFDITPYTEPSNSSKGNPVPSIPVGSTVKIGTNNFTLKTNTEAEYKAPVSKGASTVTIPDTITVSGHKYNVTTIANNAFKGSKKLKTLVIGKYIKKIGKNAFYNCKKLKKITIKTSKLTLKNIGKNAFKGTAKKASVKVPKKKLKLYKKVLKKRGLSKSAKVK